MKHYKVYHLNRFKCIFQWNGSNDIAVSRSRVSTSSILKCSAIKPQVSFAASSSVTTSHGVLLYPFGNSMDLRWWESYNISPLFSGSFLNSIMPQGSFMWKHVTGHSSYLRLNNISSMYCLCRLYPWWSIGVPTSSFLGIIMNNPTKNVNVQVYGFQFPPVYVPEESGFGSYKTLEMHF